MQQIGLKYSYDRFHERSNKGSNKAKEADEVPIGAVVVCDGKIISRAFNQREKKQNALAHAEVVAINKALPKNSAHGDLTTPQFMSPLNLAQCALVR